jgi:hypothetical protein
VAALLGVRELVYLVLKVYGSIEVWDFGVNGFADDFTFTGMEERSHFWPQVLTIVLSTLV